MDFGKFGGGFDPTNVHAAGGSRAAGGSYRGAQGAGPNDSGGAGPSGTAAAAGGLINAPPPAVVDEEGLKHNPGLATYWSPEEQAILEQGLIEFASEQSIVRYAKIAMLLPNKTIRDVALRYQWLSRKEYAMRMEAEAERNIPRENNNTRAI